MFSGFPPGQGFSVKDFYFLILSNYDLARNSFRFPYDHGKLMASLVLIFLGFVTQFDQ